MKRYPKEVKAFIKQYVQGTTTKDLVALVNTEFGLDFTESKMRAYKKNHNLKSGTSRGLPKGLPSKQYPKEIKEFIAANYKDVGPKDMTDLLNKTFGTDYTHSQLKSYYANHKLNSGQDGRFQKGHVPANKGKKGVGGWEPTQFKKGHKPWNYRPVGTERVNGDGYVDIKIADPNKWKGKHILIWEAANGPVPKGHVIIFGDGNKLNFGIDNLILVSRAQLARLNQNNLIQNDAELTRTGIIIADIYSKIGERKRR